MKILSAKAIRAVDQLTTSYEPVTSLQLMENAGKAFSRQIAKHFPDKTKKVAVCCGVGNNGGDGLVAARHLTKRGYDSRIFIIPFSPHPSDNFSRNLARAERQGITITTLSDERDIPDFSAFDIIVDAIFGIGLSRQVTGLPRAVIEAMNKSGGKIVSVDVPSGLFLDKHTQFAVKAALTITFQIHKLAFFLPENHQFTGKVRRIANIGLSQKAIDEAPSRTFVTTSADIVSKLRPLNTFTHKGEQGHALIIGGSKGKTGAVILSSKAALKSGCGLVSAYMPRCGTTPMHANFPEAMVIEDAGRNFLKQIAFHIKPDAIGLGMGMGAHAKTRRALLKFLRRNRMPLVVDADALNILSRDNAHFRLLPPHSILTPHPKEWQRVIGEWENDFDKIEKTMRFAQAHNLIIVLKGAFSIIFADGDMYVNNSGSPALATAGSGDVLTGIITGLRAQGYTPLDAALIGVYTHGLTANTGITHKNINPRSFLASDCIENISNAFYWIEKKRGGYTFYPQK